MDMGQPMAEAEWLALLLRTLEILGLSLSLETG